MFGGGAVVAISRQFGGRAFTFPVSLGAGLPGGRGCQGDGSGDTRRREAGDEEKGDGSMSPENRPLSPLSSDVK